MEIINKVWSIVKNYTADTWVDYKSAWSVYPNVILWTVAITALIVWFV